MTTHICDLNPSDEPPESARALLDRHGLPEDVIDGALALHAQELAAVQRQAHDASGYHMGQACKPEYECGVRATIDLIAPTSAAVPVPPPADQTALRDRIAAALYALMLRNGWDGERTEPVVREMDLVLDAVLAVLPEQTDRAAECSECDDTGACNGGPCPLRRVAAEEQPAETRQSCPCGQDGCEYCDVDEAVETQIREISNECCGSEPPSDGTWGDCWCTLPPGHDGEHQCQPCTDRHGAPGWTDPTTERPAVGEQPGSPDCTCIPFTRQGGKPRYCGPTDTVDMISGWEIGRDCPHHKPAVGEQPETQEARHLGGRANAEDCPACEGTNPPYPFLCPGPDAP